MSQSGETEELLIQEDTDNEGETSITPERICLFPQ